MNKYRLILFLCFVVGYFSQPIFAQDVSNKFNISYISADHIYLKAGKNQGLQVGTRLIIRENNDVVAELEIVYVAQNSSSCKIIRSTREITTTDIVIKIADSKTQAVKIPKASESKKTPKPDQRQITVKPAKKEKNRAVFSGSASMQWYHVEDLSPSKLNFDQPGLRLNLRIRQLWGKDYTIRIKTRSRYNRRERQFTSYVPSREWRNRVYEVSFSYHDKSALFNYKLGRIISNQFSGVGYIDGLLLQQNISETFHFGVFAGTQPEWHYANFQTSLQKYGGYLNISRGSYNKGGFKTTIAAAGEYHGSTVSREFIYIQNNIFGKGKWNLFQSAELDINRNWKRERTGRNLSLSNLYVYGSYRINDHITTGLTFDDRKNYITYETRTIADSLFDDVQRYGLRGNISLRLPGNFTLFVNTGARKRKTDTKMTTSYSANISNFNITRHHFSLFASFFGFSNYFTRGYNYSVQLGKRFRSGHYVSLSYGSYIYTISASNRLNQWIRLNGQFELFSSFYLSDNYEYNWGDDAPGHRIYAEFGYRF